MKNMELKTAFAVALALALTAGSAAAGGKPDGVAAAECPPPVANFCDTELSNLCTAIDVAREGNGGSLKQRDRDTMVSKVIGAAIKINEEKYVEAYDKLDQIRAKLDSLVEAPKPKISEADADSITAALNSAEMCFDNYLP